MSCMFSLAALTLKSTVESQALLIADCSFLACSTVHIGRVIGQTFLLYK